MRRDFLCLMRKNSPELTVARSSHTSAICSSVITPFSVGLTFAVPILCPRFRFFHLRHGQAIMDVSCRTARLMLHWKSSLLRIHVCGGTPLHLEALLVILHGNIKLSMLLMIDNRVEW